MTKAAQVRTMLVMARALGAVSALYLLSLSTPMPEIIGVLRKMRCPDVVTELMYLIYRYIFLLFHMHDAMKNSAMSRLGYLGLSHRHPDDRKDLFKLAGIQLSSGQP